MAIEVRVFTADYVVWGSLQTEGERLTDVLNLKNEQGLVLFEAQAVSLHAPGKTPPLRMPKVRIEKSAITMAIPLQRDLTHKSMFRKSNRLAFEVVVFVPQFQIQGVLHLTERIDLRKGFSLRPEDFVPLTEAVMTFAPNPSVSLRADTVIFNKHRMMMLAEIRPRSPLPNPFTGELPVRTGMLRE